jgi:AcrR family transcriptional regulator
MIEVVRERRNTLVRQRQIISAAGRLIVKYGSEHVTVRRIAKEIGVSEGAIYRHFKSKRDILSLLVDDIESTLITDIEKDLADGLNSLETLERAITNIEQRKGVSFQVIAEIVSFGDKKLNNKIYNALNRYIGCIKGVLSEGVKAGVIRQDIDLEATATLFFGMIQGLINIWTLSHYRLNLKQKYASLWNIFAEAVIKR